MKPALWLFMLLIIGLPEGYGQLTLQDSLIAYYPFSGNALDASGNNNHGTVNGASLTTDRFGLPNEAYFFDGINDYLELNGAQKFYPQLPVTIAFWIQLNDLLANPVFTNDFEDNNYNGVALNVVSGNLSLGYGDGGPLGPASRRSKNSIDDLQIGTWYHIAGIMRGALDMSLYINGVEVCGTYSGSGAAMSYDSLPGMIARADGGTSSPNNYYHGKIDELRFYNRVLTKAEIRILAKLEIGPDTICSGDSAALGGGLFVSNTISWTPTSSLSCTSCQTPTAFPNTTTDYQAILTGMGGCQDTVFWTVEVENCTSPITCDSLGLLAGFSASTNFMEVNIGDASSGLVDSILWTFGDGNNLSSSPGGTQSYVYTSPGNYTICQVVYGTADFGEICADTFCTQISAILPCDSLGLQAIFSILPDFMEVGVQDQSSGSIDSILWEWGDGSSATGLPGSASTHTYSLPGIYQICQTIYGSTPGGLLCSDQLCQPFLAELPCDSLNLLPGFISTSAYLEFEFADQSAGNITEISWDFGDGTIAVDTPGTNISHIYAQPDTYQVCLSVFGLLPNGNLCSATICDSVIATVPLVCSDLGLLAAFTAITTDYTTNFEDFSQGIIDSLQWFTGDGITYQTSPGASFDHTYTYLDTFDACLVVYGHLFDGTPCTDTSCIPVSPDITTPCDTAPVVADFLYNLSGLDVMLVDMSYGSQIDEINWNLDGVNWQGGMIGDSVAHSFPGAGIFPICLEAISWFGDTLACRDTICEMIEIRTTSRDRDFIQPRWNAYPNPFSHQLQLQISPEFLLNHPSLEVFDSRGRLILIQSISQELTRLPSENWANGLYLVILKGDRWKAAKKVFKQD